MRYYRAIIIGSNTDEFAYSSDEIIPNYTKVELFFRNRQCFALVLGECEKPSFQTKNILSVSKEKLYEKQIKLCEFISKYYAANLSMCVSIFTFADETKYEKRNINNHLELNLSKKQNECYEFCQKHQISLIFGDTGSGKTEIYAKFINEYIKNGKQVLFLMPEISLTPQMCKRMDKYFKDLFIVWHSKITKATKKKYLNDFLSGKKPIVIGARSALFLPFLNLGLIIIDEEHDSSYKSSKYPCYNARDLAIYFAKTNDIKLILGSATPSLQSFYNKNIKSFRLKGTFFDSSKDILYDNSDDILSDCLLDELEKNLDKKEQSMIFLPVRGNYRQVVCCECGSRKMCPNCSVPMSLHNNTYKCHYCGKKQYLKNTCEVCNSAMLESKIIGTAELKSRLEKFLPNAKIAKLDSDELSSNKRLKEILDDFSNEKIDILIGTQLISKGHDYKKVSFCAILGLDEYLFYPDFKARESTLALAIQVAGRAGRIGHSRVLINTKNKDFFENYIENYDLFLEDEEKYRFNYPPFKRLLRFIISSSSEEEANSICSDLSQHLDKNRLNDDDYEIIGYGKCAIEKINKQYRYYILLRSNKKMLLSNLALQYKHLPKVTIDIDPIHFS